MIIPGRSDLYREISAFGKRFLEGSFGSNFITSALDTARYSVDLFGGASHS